MLLIVLPGALTTNGQRRERAEAVAWQIGKVVLELDRHEQLPPRTPGVPIAAVCELQDLRSVGWTGPIWRVIRHSNDSNPVHGIPDLGDVTGMAERRCLLDSGGAFPGAVSPLLHDLSGLGEWLRMRLDTGISLELTFPSGTSRQISEPLPPVRRIAKMFDRQTVPVDSLNLRLVRTPKTTRPLLSLFSSPSFGHERLTASQVSGPDHAFIA